jgi:hypothetical protein
MSATYNITAHPLLSDKAKKLYADSPSAFDAVAEAAERTLGLHATSFTDSKAEDAKLAITYQVNHDLAQTEDAEIYEAVERGERTWRYRKSVDPVSSKASGIAQRLLDSLKSNSTRSSSSIGVGVTRGW